MKGIEVEPVSLWRSYCQDDPFDVGRVTPDESLFTVAVQDNADEARPRGIISRT